MKKNTIILTALSLALMTACTDAIPVPVGPDQAVTVRLTASFDPASRTTLVTGNKVEWLAGDAITVFDGTKNKRVETPDEGPTATFTVDLESEGPWYALYPYDAAATLDTTVIATTLPAIQTAVAGTFDDDLNIAVALSSGGKLTFKNVLGLIKFTLTSSDIDTIFFMGNDHEAVAGDIDVDYNEGVPAWTSTRANRSICLTTATGNFAPGTYYFAVLPQTFASGVSFTIKKSGAANYKYIRSTKSMDLERSTILNVGNIEESIITDSDPIVFADPDVKAALLAVSGIDANGDDEISYAEAAAVTYKKINDIVGGEGLTAAALWGDLSKIDSFDELQYFTGFQRTATENRLPPMFRGCTNLKSVVLPANTQRIANYAFYQSGIEHIEFPVGLATIYGNAFFGCTSLKEVILPNTVVSISATGFRGCTAMEDLVLSEGLTQLNNNMFHSCTSLTYVRIPDAVTSIGENAFYGCTKLVRVDFSDSPGLKTIGNFAFKNNTALESFYIPSANVIQSIGRHAFYGNTKMKLRSRNFHSVTSLGDSAFFQTAIANITLDNAGLKTIPGGCFYQCTSMQNAYISPSVTTIGEYAFYGCSNLKGVTCVAAGNQGIEMPEGVTRIERYTFSNCRYLTTLSLPEGLTFIGDRGLRQCKFTGDIELPSTLEEISARAFEGSAANYSDMNSLKVKADVPPTVTAVGASYDLFLNVPDTCLPRKIYVPTESVDAYKAANGWSIYAARIEGF